MQAYNKTILAENGQDITFAAALLIRNKVLM